MYCTVYCKDVTYFLFGVVLLVGMTGCRKDVYVAKRQVDTASDSGPDTQTGTGVSTDSQSDSQSDSDSDSTTDSQLPQIPLKGLAMLFDDVELDVTLLDAAWCFNFMSTPIAGQCEEPLFVPMIWGRDEITQIADVAAAGYTEVLGFNEPAIEVHANIPVDEAITLWPQVTQYPEIRVGSPAVSNTTQAWMEEFMTQVETDDLRVDFIAIHYFGVAAGDCDTADGLDAMITWAEQWERPIWLTEFGCRYDSAPDTQTVTDFLPLALEAIQRHPLVERIAWYPNDANSALMVDGALTPLGESYAAGF